MASYNAQKEKGVIDLSGDVLRTLSNLCMSEEHSDIALVVDNTKIPAHKTILSARSPYFHSLFNSGFAEASQNEIELKEVPLNSFKVILKYIYTGCVSLSNLETEQIIDMCRLAEMYDFGSLKEALTKNLEGSITMSNCVSILNSAELHSLDELQTECLKFVDCHSVELLEHDTFKYLSQTALCSLLKRDTFYSPEIEIFKAFQNWSKHNPDANIKDVISLMRWSLMSSNELIEVVLPSNILEPAQLLSVIKGDHYSISKLPRISKSRADLNIATIETGAKTICGENGANLLDENSKTYDLSKTDCTYHPIGEFQLYEFNTNYAASRMLDDSIIVDLGSVHNINFISILLMDKDNRSYSYHIDTSLDGVDYKRLIDYTKYYCRSMQRLHFPSQPVKFIKLVGTHATGITKKRLALKSVSEYDSFCKSWEFVKKEFRYDSFDVVKFKAMYLTEVNGKIVDGIIKPNHTIGCVTVIEGLVEGFGSNNMLNYNLNEFTHHNIEGCIILQFNQPFHIDSLRMLIGINKMSDKYAFHIETSMDKEKWDTAVDKRNEKLSGWQEFRFESRPTTFIKISGIDAIFHCSYFECPCGPIKPIITST